MLGAGGRMGSEVCRAVARDPETDLVAAVDTRLAGTPISVAAGIDSDLSISESIETLAENGAEVAVDFTVAESAVSNIAWCLEHGIHVVVGTTGIAAEDVERLATKTGPANLLIAPNFAIGAVLMMSFSQQAARWLPDAEIIELHHPGKLDAPSGTALKTLDAIAGARQGVPSEPQVEASESLTGARGGEKDGVRVHSIRLPGLVAHQEVIFGSEGQTLSIRHDSTDRSSFMPGVLLAVKAIASRPGLTVGLESVLGV